MEERKDGRLARSEEGIVGTDPNVRVGRLGHVESTVEDEEDYRTLGSLRVRGVFLARSTGRARTSRGKV